MGKKLGLALVLAGTTGFVGSVLGISNYEPQYSEDFNAYRELDKRTSRVNLRKALSHPDSIRSYQDLVARQDSLMEANDGFITEMEETETESAVNSALVAGILVSGITILAGRSKYGD